MHALWLAVLLAATPIHRSKAAVRAFVKANPCPSTCALYKKQGEAFVLWRRCGGCAVDHVVPLVCGGADHPSNMQWLSVEENLLKGGRCPVEGTP